MNLLSIEGSILLFFQSLRGTVLDGLISGYTRLGNAGAVWILLCLVLLCRPKYRRAGLAGLFALVWSLLLTNCLIKPLVSRTRPWLVIEGLIPLVAEHDPNSFPSGHTSASFACALAWWRTLPRRWMRSTGVALAALMGLSRLYVGVHFPTDVLCGALIGSLCGYLGWRVLLWGEKRRKDHFYTT